MSKLPIARFDGGMTDYIYKAPENFAETVDNLFITKNLGLKSRSGQRIYSLSYPRVTENDRITRLFGFDNDVLIKSVDTLYALDLSAGFSEILGEGDRSIIYNHANDEDIDHTILNNQIIITSPELKFPPVLVYASTGYDATTLGSDELASDPTITPAAGGDTVSYIYAFCYYRTYSSGSLTIEEYGPPIYVSVESDAATAVDADHAYSIDDVPVLSNALNTFYKTGTDDTDLKIRVFRTTNNGDYFYYTGIELDNEAEIGLSSAITLAEALRVNLNAHAADGDEHTAADATNFPLTSPEATNLASLITLVTEMLTDFDAHEADDDAGAGSYHDAQEAEDATLDSTAAPTTLAECITRLNDIKEKFNIHDADATSHDVGSQHQETTADAAEGSDTTSDAELVLNESLYTEGGVSENAAPPLAKYVTTAKDAVWFCNINTAPNRIQQSKRLAPYACPGDYYIDVDEDITGVGTSRDYPIVFTENKVYRIEGFIDNIGRGDLQKRVITDRVGCINYRTIVQTRQGLYFAGRDGFYFTDGYDIKCISREKIDETYRDIILTQARINNLNAAYNSIEQKVYFSAQLAADNDIIFSYDEIHEAWTTITGQTDFIPTAMTSIGSQFLRGDDEGYIYVFDNDASTDMVREVGVDVTTWGEEAIVYTFKHIALNFGEFDTKKWVNKVTLQLRDETGQHVKIESYDEDSLAPVELKPITSVGLLAWGESGTSWGSTGLTWGRSHIVSKTRRFPAGHLRTRFKQLNLTNQDDAVIQCSDDVGVGYVDAAAKTIRIGTLASAISNANNLKIYLNAHYNDYGSGTEEHVAQQTNVTTDDATDLSSLITLVSALVSSYDSHDADAELEIGWSYHQDQESSDYSLSSVAAPTDLDDCLDRLADLKEKFNKHIIDGDAHTNGDSLYFIWTGSFWDDKIVNYRIILANSVGGYNTEFTVTFRDSDIRITVSDSGGNLIDGSQAWEVIGYKKNEVLDLQALTYTYTPLSDRGGYYKTSEAEGNE